MINNGTKTAIIVQSNKDKSTSNVAHFVKLLELNDIDVNFIEDFPEQPSSNQQNFYFIDCTKFSSQDLLPQNILQSAGQCNIVLFNCRQQELCEKLALIAGIKGFFYNKDKADIIVKGIEIIKEGGLWYRRAIMDAVLNTLLEKHTSKPPTAPLNDSQLTKRETTIVSMIASGAQNKEIAEQLHISPNTVKTHLYSIFRKTNSRNRIELLAWSQQYELQA